MIDQYEEWEKLNEGHSFFPADTVPKRFHSIQGLIRKRDGKNGKKGDIFSATTIRDVVRWSYTLRGGKDIGFDFMYEEDDSHAPCKMGYCE